MIRRPPRSTLLSSSAASDVYKRQLCLSLSLSVSLSVSVSVSVCLSLCLSVSLSLSLSLGPWKYRRHYMYYTDACGRGQISDQGSLRDDDDDEEEEEEEGKCQMVATARW